MEIEKIVIKAEPCDLFMEPEDFSGVNVKTEIIEKVLQNNDKPFKCGICGHRAMTDALLRVHMKIHLVKRLHECSVCQETFFFVTELNRHVLTHTEGRSNYECKVCGKDCFTQEALNKHFKIHSLEKPFKCKLCERTFSEDAYLRVHERSHHGEEFEKKHMIRDGTLVDLSLITIKNDLPTDYECPICHKNFLDEEFLKIHLKLHDDDPLSHSIFGTSVDSYERVVLMHSEIDIEKCRTIIPVEETEKWFFECGYIDENGLKCPRRFGEKESAEIHEKSHRNNFQDGDLVESIGENMTRCKEIVKGKEKTVFKCTLCSRFFPVPSKLRSHMRTHTGEKPFKCDTCGKAFGTAGSLKDHSYLHSDVKPFKCKLCPKSFTKNCSLEDHIRSHTGEKPYECNICKKKYATIVILNQHLLAHSKEKPFKCDVCDKSFIYLCNLKYHMVSHTGAKPFACDLCDKAFALKSALRMHMMEHTGNKPHSCRFCSKKFTTVGGLKKHERVHTGEKPYKCTVCDKGFTQTSSLSRHMDVHTGEKPYKCTICHKGLTSGSYLKIHMRIHRGEPPYQCKSCPETFTALKKYRTHIKIHKRNNQTKQIVQKNVHNETDSSCIDNAKNDKSDLLEKRIKVKEEVEREGEEEDEEEMDV